MYEWFDGGIVSDIAPLIKSIGDPAVLEWDKFTPAAQKAVKFGNYTLGLTVGTSDQAMGYRRDLFEHPEEKAAFKAKYGENRVTSDPMEAAYTSLFLWKNTVEKAGSFDVAEIQENAGGVSFDAPEGTVTINGDNNHISKTALVGEIRPDGLIYEVWSSGEPIEPDPFLEGYDWAGDLSGN